jgi:signal transduction histidine kinase
LIIGLLAVMALLTLMQLYWIEQKIRSEGKVIELFDIILEIRRFEKNFFLYDQTQDFLETNGYVAQARAILQTVQQTDLPLLELAHNLEEYELLLNAYYQDQGAMQEHQVRSSGKRLVAQAEALARAERQHLSMILTQYKQKFILSTLLLILSVIILAQLLTQQITAPLRQLEAQMRTIVGGNTLHKLQLHAQDREILLLEEAFNKVIQELALRQQHLLRSEKLAALGTLLSGVAHELNNPLSNISTSCQILQEEWATVDAAFALELLGQIDSQTLRARAIVRALLDFSRDKKFTATRIALRSLIDETLHFIRGDFSTAMQLHIEVAPNLQVAGDKQRLQQVLLNLLKNAADALPQGGEIHLTAHEFTLAEAPTSGLLGKFYPVLAGKPALKLGKGVEITLADSGSGMTPEVAARIFDPFFTTKAVGVGSGLGLFIVHEIIEEHGGHIAVESQPGQGSVFVIWLPGPAPELA